MDGQFKQQIS